MNQPTCPNWKDQSSNWASRSIQLNGSETNLICGFELDQAQLEPLLSANEQSFVPNVLKQIQTLVRDHMSDVLVDHCANQQIKWEQTVDLQRLVNDMSFTHTNNLSRWTGLRTTEQFNLFAECSLLTGNTPALCISSSSACPINESPNLDLPVLDDLTQDQPECPSDMDAQQLDNGSVQSTICS